LGGDVALEHPPRGVVSRAGLVPAIYRSLTVAQPEFMVVGQHTEAVVRAVLGVDAGRLVWGHREAFYQRMGLAFSTFRRYLAGEYGLGAACTWLPSRTWSPTVIRRRRWTGSRPTCRTSRCVTRRTPGTAARTCLWDSRRHPTLVIEGVRSLHHDEMTPVGPVANPGYVSSADYLLERSQVTMTPAPPVVEFDVVVTGTGDLGPLRSALAAWSTQRGFAGVAVDDVLLATVELVTNGLVHGVPPVRVRGWYQRRVLVVQVDDTGGVAPAPDAGYRLPDVSAKSGRGPWIARRLADTVMVHADGVTTWISPARPAWRSACVSCSTPVLRGSWSIYRRCGSAIRPGYVDW
jgi:anti-sigma regulatory factor (Ser/Thr protein kinase)